MFGIHIFLCGEFIIIQFILFSSFKFDQNGFRYLIAEWALVQETTSFCPCVALHLTIQDKHADFNV